ncbi:MAG: MlaD family protein [Candidatus Marinimicrobia bacterium]|nr:MlaD family protein [Candidatus Neomarinimicrobiota bacterium]MCF7922382.1 MlaD family protein [Candidatus Neomarinimicrobiota bacterium]
MVTSAQKIRLGIFLSITSILLITTFVIVAGQRLIQKRDFYFITYQNISVTGLQSGSSVKYYGINIGQVEDISIDPEDIKNVTVEISVKKGTPIKEDVLATLISVGITGIKQVELTGGTNEAKLLLPGSDIQPGTSYMEDITGKAELIAEKFEILLNNITAVTSEDNRIKVGNILTNTQDLISENREVLHASLANMNTLLEENRKGLKTTLQSFNTLVNENRQMLKQVLTSTDVLIQESREPLQRVFTQMDSASMAMANFMVSTQASLNKLDMVLDNASVFSENLAKTDVVGISEDISKTLNTMNETFTHVDLTILKTRQDLIKSIESLKVSAEYLSEFSRKVNDDPSLLLRSKR